MALKMHSSLAMPAGQWLKEAIIIPEKIPMGKLAESLSVSRQALSAVLNGRSAMTFSLAVRLEKVLGISADTLMNMQTTYEMAEAREKEKSFHCAMISLKPRGEDAKHSMMARQGKKSWLCQQSNAMNTMTYKGYHARVTFEAEDGVFVGRLAGIKDRIPSE